MTRRGEPPTPEARPWYRALTVVSAGGMLLVTWGGLDGDARVWVLLGLLVVVVLLGGRAIYEDRDRSRTPY